MRSANSPAVPRTLPDISWQFLSLAIGLGVSWLIFFSLSRIQKPSLAEPATPMDDLRSVILPVEPPPPPVRPQETPPIATSNLIVLEAARSDSPVKLPVIPLPTEIAPRVLGVPKIDFSAKPLKPATIDATFDTEHVYERSEVDQRCVPLVRVHPVVNKFMLNAARQQRSSFLFIVNRDGSVEGIRLIASSGSRDLDEACSDALKNWRFRPAMRKGRPVRQWVEQSLIFKLEKGSPLEVY